VTERTWTVYGLIDPRQPRDIRYVGITIDPRRREGEHRRVQDKGNRRLVTWESAARVDAISLLALPLEVHRTLDSAQDGERWWIRELREDYGCDLLNLNNGGAWNSTKCGPKSAITRARISATLAKHVEDRRAKILQGVRRPAARAAHLAANCSPEKRAKLSAAHLGRPKSPEHRAKISVALKGRVPWNKRVEERS